MGSAESGCGGQKAQNNSAQGVPISPTSRALHDLDLQRLGKADSFFGRCCCRRRASQVPAVVLADPIHAHRLYLQIRRNVREFFHDGAGNWVEASDVERMLIATEGDVVLAQEKLIQAVQWRDCQLAGWISRYSPSAYPNEARLIGIGHCNRPMMYGCAVHQRKGEVMPIEWACAWHYAIQGNADPFTYIDLVLDVYGFQNLLNLNIYPYFQVAASLDSYYAERFHRFVIIDMPLAAQLIWRTIRALLPPKTRSKVFFVSSKRPDEMEVLYELCVDESMRSSVSELLQMNRRSTTRTGRVASRAHTDAFLKMQKAKRAPAPKSPSSHNLTARG